LAPEFVPPPDAASGLVGETIAELVGEQEDLSAMMGFVGKHVAEHGGAGGPSGDDFVSSELGDAARGLRGECVGEHAETLLGTLLEGGGGLLFGAAMRVERRGTFEVRGVVAEPVATNIVKMGEDGGDGASATASGSGSCGAPGAWVEMSEEELVHGVVDGVGFKEDVADFGECGEGLWRHGGSKDWWAGGLGDEIDLAVGQVVHGAGDFDGALLFEAFEDGAATANLGEAEDHVGASDGVDVRGILAGLFPIEFCGGNGRLDAGEKTGEVAKDHIIDGTFDGTAGGVSQDEDDFRAGNTASELHTAEHVIVDHVARDATHEDVTDSGVENNFGRNAGIETAEDDSGGILAGGAGAFFCEKVAGSHFPGAEALVSFF